MIQRIVPHGLLQANGVSAAFTEADIRKQRMANFPCIIKAGTNPLPVGLLQCKFKAVFAEAVVAGLTGGNKQPDIFIRIRIGMTECDKNIVS